MLLNIFEPRSMSVTPLHLLGSLRFPIFGTGTTRPSCHSAKSTSSCQNLLRRSRRVAKFFSVSDLDTSGGTSLSPGDLPLFNFAIASHNFPTWFKHQVPSFPHAVGWWWDSSYLMESWRLWMQIMHKLWVCTSRSSTPITDPSTGLLSTPSCSARKWRNSMLKSSGKN